VDIALITDRAVREALHAIRYAQPLTGNPLVALAAVTARLRAEGVTDSAIGREWTLARLLEGLIAEALTALREPETRRPAAADHPTAALAQARVDFRVGDPNLEAWSVLRYRYVAPSPLQMREMAEKLGIGERTLRRRLNQGHGLLAAALREHELVAGQALGRPDAAFLPAPRSDPRDLPADCPYRGLQAFREADTGYFFGRESFAERLVEQVAAGPMVGVIGASGSGKSSVVLAGLLPWLRAEHAAMGRRLAVAEVRPGPRPFHALAAALLPLRASPVSGESDRRQDAYRLAEALADGSVRLRELLARESGAGADPDRLLLVVDQLEELYSQGAAESVVRGFQEQLLEAALGGDADQPAQLVLTLRADFMSHALAFRPFADALDRHAVLLGPMDSAELARAIRLPAEKQGRSFEPGLVERIVDDVGEAAGALPLLEFALTMLWERQAAGWLTHAGYEAIGRVGGAVAQHAEATFDCLDPAQRSRVGPVFVQLVRPGDGTADTRRMASRAELDADWPLVQRLADERLVTTGRDVDGHETVEIVHEALLGSWHRLQEWMAADRRFRTWQERLRFGLRQWTVTGQDDGALLRGAPLAAAEGWLQERGADLVGPERAFVEAGLALRDRRERERETQLRRELAAVRTLRRRAFYLSGALALVAALGVTALALAFRANGTAQEATARELAAASVASRPQDPARSALLALHAVTETLGAGGTVLPEAWTALAAVLPDLRLQHAFRCADGSGHAAPSPDGALMALACSDGRLHLWDAGTGQVRQEWPDPGGSGELAAFSPDGHLLASAELDGTVVIWRVATGARWRTLTGHTERVWHATFSPDGRRLATHDLAGQVILWDTGSWRAVATLQGVPSRMPNALAFDRASARLATAHVDGLARVWDAADGTPLRRLSDREERLNGVTFSPDGRLLATLGGDHVVRLWDEAGAEPRYRLVGHTNEALVAAFSPDGGRLVTGSADNTARVWDVATGRALRELTGHDGFISGVAFSPDGRLVYTTSPDGTARSWELESGSALLSLHAPNGLWNPQPSRDGRRLAASGDGGQTWVVGGALSTVELRVAYERLNDIGFNADGSRVLVPHIRGASIFDAADGRELLALQPAVGSTYGEYLDAKFSPDGRRVVTAGADGSVRVWDAATGDALGELGRSSDQQVQGSIIAFRPDGRQVAVAAGQTTAHVWDLATSREVSTLSGPGAPIDAVAYSHDGRYLATTSDSSAQLRDPDTGAVVRPIAAHSGGIGYLAFSPDSRRLATAGSDPRDGTIKVWDVATGALQRRFPLTGGAIYLSFHPVRPLLAGSSWEGVTTVWDLSTGRELFTISGPVGANYVRFTPDGTGIATAYFAGVVRIQHGVLDIQALQRLVSDRLPRWWTAQECTTYLHRAACPPVPPRLVLPPAVPLSGS
jgi:WD40 repeat protein